MKEQTKPLSHHALAPELHIFMIKPYPLNRSKLLRLWARKMSCFIWRVVKPVWKIEESTFRFSVMNVTVWQNVVHCLNVCSSWFLKRRSRSRKSCKWLELDFRCIQFVHYSNSVQATLHFHNRSCQLLFLIPTSVRLAQPVTSRKDTPHSSNIKTWFSDLMLYLFKAGSILARCFQFF